MISKRWREGLTYAAMSIFVAWHTLATVTAPAPVASGIVQSLRVPLDPYLGIFGLDHQADHWGFFSPDPGKKDQLRYLIRDASGKSHTFVPAATLNWFYPTYIWFRDLYDVVLDSPDEYGQSYAARFCHEHASLRPVSITFLKVEEGDFKPADYLNGKRPMDPEFLTVRTLRRVGCPRS
jgi:hypothetical protein